uniref:CHCH domain-containing protein n=1 Tax=Aplanochytrium stocchinoi TaxID=215587 RepID=A0A6S8FC41_9STRA|mmetsp:Transcript_5127/g.5873  ORF Transcript_5127/g.5873 Transcript_5127/m.5873 type:complete len:115 (-) Transcript_5127:214-558(-)
MAFIRGGGAVTPPLKGSFPLDHKAECKSSMKEFLLCLKTNSNEHHKCQKLSKEYLTCRMQKGLMADEDLDELGFKHTVKFANDPENVAGKKEAKGFLGGLSVKPINPNTESKTA